MKVEDIIVGLKPWIRERRWYDLKDQKIIAAELFWKLKVKDVFLTLIKVRTREVERLYYLPLTIRTKEFSEYCRGINGVYVCEAEYDPAYYNSIFYTLIDDNFNELVMDLYSKLERAIFVEPIIGSTNPVVKVLDEKGNNLILKSYRKVHKINREYLFLKKLREKSVNIPELLASLRHKSFGVFSIVTRYVKSLGDGGTPFAENFREFLERSRDVPEALSKKLGKVTAEFHNQLADNSEWLFKPEVINHNDVLMWENRVISRIRILNLPLSSLGSYIKNFNLYLGLKKIQIHQDYHLAQLLYTYSGDFLILDLEGEPGRGEEELLVKEPAIRDLGCMIRSFDYLVYSTLSVLERDKVYEEATKNSRIVEWRSHVIKTFLSNYLQNIDQERILGSSMDLDKLAILALPWILEKALYEMMYEVRYRPHLLYIPLNGVRELIEKTHPVFQIIKLRS
ncbi:MAG: hypothetical protein DRJ44_00020 [Thermoprotei archaeon]|nr:MAG: hypothetical protein DRJ44_00020 [Thermoprotei archaeon]